MQSVFHRIVPLILGASVAANAQTAPQTTAEAAPVKLENVVVTATRSAVSVNDVPSRISIIGADDLTATTGVTLADTLKKNASVDIIQYPGGLSGIGIRGFRPEFSGTSQHVLVLIDGRPSGATSLGNLPTSAIERIEVLKGPASSLYGANAMAGVVNIITKHSSGPIGGHLSASVGSYETLGGSGAVGGSVGRVDFDAAASTLTQFDNYTMGNGEVRPNTSMANHSGYFRVGYALSDTWRIDASANTYVGIDLEAPGAYTDGTSGQSSKELTLTGGDLRLTGSLDRHAIHATLYGTGEHDKRRTETAGLKPYRSAIRETTFEGLQLQDNWALTDSLSLLFGGDYERVENENRSYGTNEARTKPSSVNDERVTTAGFVDATALLFSGRLRLNGGVRYDSIDLTLLATPLRPDVVPGTTTLTTTNPRAGAVFTLSPHWRLHATAGRAFVAPLANQLAGYYDETVGAQRRLTTGNPNLSPETAWTYDAGVGYDNRVLSVDATVFQTDVEDKIESVITTNTTALRQTTYVNASTAKSSGLEIDLAADVGRLWQAPAGVWRLSGGYTHLFDREQALSTGVSVLRNVAKDKLNLAFTYAPGRLTLRASARHVRGMWDQDNSKLLVYTGGKGGLFEYPSFTVCDLYASFRVLPRQVVALSVDNAFDRFYYEKNDYPLNGRSFKATYRFEF